MTRTEYIAKLTKYLRKLPQKDYEEALEYFMEYFEEAGPENEAQVIAELGTPKEAAHEAILPSYAIDTSCGYFCSYSDCLSSYFSLTH